MTRPRFDPGTFSSKRAPEEEPPRRGRPFWEPSDEQRRLVKNMAGVGVTVMDIATILEISEQTLRKHLMPEIEMGRAEANAVVAGCLFKQIQGGNFQAMQFWARVKMGWVEQPADQPGTGIEELTDDDLGAQIEAIRRKQAFATRARGLEAPMQE